MHLTDEQFWAALATAMGQLTPSDAMHAVRRIAIAMRDNFGDPDEQADETLMILGDYGIEPIADLEEAEYDDSEAW